MAIRSVPVVNLIPLRIEMRVVDPTIPRYGTDLIPLWSELLHSLSRWWDSGAFGATAVAVW